VEQSRIKGQEGYLIGLTGGMKLLGGKEGNGDSLIVDGRERGFLVDK